MKLLALATTYILSSTQMYLQFPTGSGGYIHRSRNKLESGGAETMR